jgi:hypothetical protein
MTALFAAAGVFVPSAADSYVRVDMSQYTCAQFLAMPPDDETVFTAWLGGWFNQKAGTTSIDLAVFERNTRNVRQWCISHRHAQVMDAIHRALSQ